MLDFPILSSPSPHCGDTGLSLSSRSVLEISCWWVRRGRAGHGPAWDRRGKARTGTWREPELSTAIAVFSLV